MADNRIKLALYSFISQHFNVRECVYGSDFDDDEDWADSSEQYFNVEDYRYEHEYGEWSLVTESELYKYTDEYGDPYEDVEITESGYLCTVEVSTAINDERWSLLNNSSFPLRSEFNGLKKIYDDLLKENAVKPVKKKRFGLN